MNTNRQLLVCILALLVGGGMLIFETALPTAPKAQPSAPTIEIGGPFALEASDGSTVTERTYRDKWQLIYFGYTLCPDICPTTLNAIAGALDELGPLAAQVQPLFITIDPARDTREVMGKFVQAFDPRIRGLTGSPEQIDTAAKAFHVYYAKVAEADAPDGYLMEHSLLIYVMRPEDGQFVATFTYESTSDQMAERLRKFISGPTTH